jgi:hypothetical protein
MGLKKICRVVIGDGIAYTYGEGGPVIKFIGFNGRISINTFRGVSYVHVPKSLQDKLINDRKMGPKIIWNSGSRDWFECDLEKVKRNCYRRKTYRLAVTGGNKTSAYFAKYNYGNKNSVKKT